MAVRKLLGSNLLLLRLPKSQQSFFSRQIDLQSIIKRTNQLTLNRLLENNEQIDGKKWSTVREEVLTTVSTVNEFNVDNIIINRCCEANKQFLALNYISYLVDERKQDLNIASIVKYFILLSNYKQTLDSEDVKRIFQFYDDIRKKYDVLDSKTAEGCILALSLTNRWKEAINIFEESRKLGNFSTIAYTSIITAAFNNNEPEIAWRYLEQTRPDQRPQKKVYVAYIQFCQRHYHTFDESKEAIEKMFDFWVRHDIYPHVTIIMAFMQYLSNTGNWNYASTTVDKDGACGCCHTSMPRFEMSEEDHKALIKYILNNAIVGKDVFQNTTPTELNKFLKYIDETKPYDVVIDGLNAAYSLNRKSKMPTERAKELRKIVTLLREQKKRIFILGKRHMLKWSRKEMNIIENNSFLFLTNNTSEDDLFTIYAALVSGSDTYIMSRDFLRDHKFILTDLKIKRIFRNWQLTHQIMPYYKQIGSVSVLQIIYPPPYVITLHKDEKGWHIPYRESLENSENELPKSWMCLRIKQKIENKNLS
ncbi:mitochondrial ribonuclease P catalytic subunit [Chelonus insularis]|uniref:mitochondrial ribonuclease P catalytic subunit n=1 Tax=Chelonus insularis TaxID=460826 RepID=UPI00158C366E|nr:mitochondrial ribonuclease P catalytic subunit [Chelonus insularis]